MANPTWRLLSLVLVAAVLAGAACTNDAADDAVRPLVLPADEGFDLVLARERTGFDVPPGLETRILTRVYGEEGAEKPFDRVDVAVQVTTSPNLDNPLRSGAGERLRVRQGHGVLGEATFGVAARSLRWRERPGMVVEIASRSLSDDELVAVAESSDFPDLENVDVRGLPDGVSLLEESLFPTQDENAEVSYHVEYAATDEGGARLMLFVSSYDADADAGAGSASLWMIGPSLEDRVVHGHDALLAVHGDEEDGMSLFWQDGQRSVTLAGYGLSSEELLRLAERLEEPTPGQWEDVVEST